MNCSSKSGRDIPALSCLKGKHMSESQKMKTYRFEVNGLTNEVRYSEENVEQIFLPMIREWSRKQKEKGEWYVVFLAAPPATGKSTLACFLSWLAKEESISLQALGLDGFHFHQDYLNSHTLMWDGKEILMRTVKGCAETFDAPKFTETMVRINEPGVCFPAYSRQIHDVIEEVVLVDGDILLIEGNWLLLNRPEWQEAREYADETVMIMANPNQLKDRLINRKVQGGLSRKDAQAFYEKSDAINIRTVLDESVKADCTLALEDDNTFSFL